MLSDMAKLVKFGDAKQGEDLDWTIRLAMTNILQTEYRSDISRVHYIYQLGNRRVDRSSLEFQKKSSYKEMLQMVWTPAGPRVLSAVPQKKEGGFKLTGRGFVSK
jgi:hypothetical protein